MATESNFHKGKDAVREDFSDYVAHLQFHMTLQARNLVPSFKPTNPTIADSREQLLQETQATLEKQISRQML
ncbi:hypothetical protein [Calothrix sp. UHCC 0171]|uniref:hypothetical protein n=1 Tax=Calothrix sp. UHCC 0171 TaxID=3110245 RepID=UPI002B211E1A|nr:hypothetical protein [Calothrix sp. UHCC 0171]MEA5570919.1 hypothetical protein [Calothrix sp. UHCC 0171]